MTSKRLVLTLLVLFGLALVSLPASATPTAVSTSANPQNACGGPVHDCDSYVDLGMDLQSIQFTGTGSSNSVSLDFGSCNGTTCTLSGLGRGFGMFSPSVGRYAITSPENIKLELTNSTTGLWTAVTGANAISFSWGPGGSLLTGTLNLLQFQQISPIVSHGLNWYLGTADLTLTGGTLDKGQGMIAQYLLVNSPAYFNTLLGPGNAGKTIATKYGEGPIYPTPEPASVFLLGAGVLLVGGVLRSRFRHGLVRA